MQSNVSFMYTNMMLNFKYTLLVFIRYDRKSLTALPTSIAIHYNNVIEKQYISMNLKTKHTTHVIIFQTFYFKNRWNRSKPIPRPTLYITELCPGMAHLLQINEHGRVNLGLWAQTSLRVKWCGRASMSHVWVKCQPSHMNNVVMQNAES